MPSAQFPTQTKRLQSQTFNQLSAASDVALEYFFYSSYADEVMLDSPKGYWRFNESSGTTLVAQVGPNGTYYGTPGFAATGLVDNGESNAAVTFVRSEADYAKIPASTLGDSQFTWELWVKPSTAAMGTNRNLVNPGGFGISLNASNRVEVFRDPSFTKVASTQTVVANTTYHIVWTYDGSTHRIYLDDTLVITDTAGLGSRNADVSIAAYGTGGDTLGGVLDELCFYGRVLDADRRTAHHTAGFTPIASATRLMAVV